MADHEIRLGAALKFDTEKEKDIIANVEELASHRKLGEFITTSIKIMMDNPELFRKYSSDIREYGISYERDRFFKQLDSRVSEMRKKIDSIYDMAYKVYTLALFGKRLGLDKRAESIMQAQFVLQRQTDAIVKELGLTSGGFTYDSNKMEDIANRADSVLEYILDSYDSIIAELRSSITVVGPMVVSQQSHVENRGDGSSVLRQPVVGEASNTINNIQNDNNNNQRKNQGSSYDNSSNLTTGPVGDEMEDEVIDFGGDGVDLSNLSSFLGD